jgi:glutamate-1-semialdehyde 2,1-aminomutase
MDVGLMESVSGAVVTPVQRERLAKANRALLDAELLARRLTFDSRPYEAHVQFSNFCNMSCVMCWDGQNPPVERMAPEVLERFAAEVAPHLSVITPHNGSEPLVAGWEEAKRIARDYSIRLALTTNAQFLDEERFLELKDIVEMVVMSVDSHIPEVFAKIRPGSKPQQVFDNVATAARLCREHGIECLVQAVFMTENAAAMPETVAWAADAGVPTVNVIQMIDINGHSGHLDPLRHFSAEYIAHIKQRCLATARSKGIRLGWDLSGFEWFDFRDPDTKIRPVRSKVANDYWDQRMKLRHPGFCKQVYDRLLVDRDGTLAPCGMATEGELRLGSLADQTFDEIWNGPSARDLRRAHYSWDYPSLCKTCRYSDPPPAKETLPFVDAWLAEIGLPGRSGCGNLLVAEPQHMAREIAPPTLRLRQPGVEIESFRLLVALGGEAEHRREWELAAPRRAGDLLEFDLPAGAWADLDTNLGYWWAIAAFPSAGSQPALVSGEVRCLIRHEPSVRVEGSTLRYSDQGHVATTYLGGERVVGWERREKLPPRPAVRRRADRVKRSRFARASANGNGQYTADRAEAAEIARAIGAAMEAHAGDGSIVAVVSKGDFRLLDVGAEAWHFPADGDGAYIGFHPPDDKWAVDHLENARRRGVTHLAFPVSSLWWLEHYRRFADHLDRHYAVVGEHQRKFLLYDLAERADSLRSETKATTTPARSGVEPVPAPEAQTLHADEVLAYTGHHRWSVRALHESGDERFPRFGLRGEGYELTDTAGRVYVDWFGAPLLLGYRHPAVEDAIRAQLEEGTTLSLTHPLEADVARMLVRMVPCAEQVAFGKNGSDVVTAAVRVARAATGRDVILQHGTHGFHDWAVASSPGVPNVLELLTRPFPYNDLEALERLLDEHRGQVAAIVMEPVKSQLPAAGYLEGVRELAHHHGALLVFDELVTGFRLANGGAQELYGVTPDLACLGKGLANGMPLSALVGERKYMELVPRVAYGMTFRGETLSLAAARAVLEVLEAEPAASRLAHTGAQVREHFAAACRRYDVNAALEGPDARMSFSFADDAALQSETISAEFRAECARNGVLIVGGIVPSLAHDEEAVARTADAFDLSLRRVAPLVVAGRRAVAEALGDRGSLERVRAGRGRLALSGRLANAESIEFAGARGVVVAADTPDGCFDVQLPADGFASDGRFLFTMRGMRDGRESFSCRVTRHRGLKRPVAEPPPHYSSGELFL